MATRLHHLIDRYNVLSNPTRRISNSMHDHPRLYKFALLVNHIFRAAAMAALAMVLPFSTLANAAICFAGSLFYRLTVETNCAYKFALPAFAGAMAFLLAGVSLLPISAYAAYVILTVSYDVDSRL